MTNIQPQPSSGLIVFPAANVPSTSPISLTPLLQHSPPSSPLSSLPVSLHTLHDTKHPSPQAIVQISRFSPKNGSWLVAPSDKRLPPHLVQNGQLTLVTIVDPLFILLPFIPATTPLRPASTHASRATTVFQPATVLAELAGVDLSALAPGPILRAVCDVKTVDNADYFRLSSHKGFEWLLAKYDALVRHPLVAKPHALSTIAQYLTPDWHNRLRAHLQSSDSPPPAQAPATHNHTVAALVTESCNASASPPADGHSAQNGTEGRSDLPDERETSPLKKKSKQPRLAKNPVKQDASAVKFWTQRATRSSTAAAVSGKRRR